jgi:virulence factor mvin family protein
VIFFIASLLVIFGREFIVLWAGANYEISYAIALILVLPVSVPLIQNLGLAVLQAKNKVKFRSIAAFCVTLVNIAISIPLAKAYGGVGAACGTAFAITFLNICVMNIYYARVIGLDIAKFWRNIGAMVVKFAPAIAVSLVINYALGLHGVSFLLICGGLYSAMFVLSAYFWAMNDYERAIFGGIAAKIRRRA